jgi:hypothetical protein
MVKLRTFCSFPVEGSGLVLCTGHVGGAGRLQDGLDNILVPLVQGLQGIFRIRECPTLSVWPS